MRLDRLIAVLDRKEIRGPLDIEVGGLAYDSRRIGPGDMFVAIRGLNLDGHRFIPSALAQGAVAVVVDRGEIPKGVTVIRVSDSRKALALLSAQWYGHPADKLRLLGLTGTDGKTTTSFLLRSVLKSAGFRPGLIGTVITSYGDREIPSQYTTPEALELHEMLAQMLSQGNDFVVMEVSSHSLSLDRVFGIPFQMGIFTNLSREHLDFHGDFQHYREAKARLFERLQGPDSRAVINLDDPNAQYLMERTRVPVVTYSQEAKADVTLLRAHFGREMTEIAANTPQGRIRFQFPLLGRYNASNALAAIAAGIALELPKEVISEGLAQVERVDGRFELLETEHGFSVIVDYAHTPQAVSRLLAAVRELSSGRVLIIFGCGGDRDRGKRPQMAEVASQMADVVILTSDNPRSEDPSDILRAVEQGIQPGTTYQVVSDRRQAIQRGLALARSGDILVVAGRGHERFQIWGDRQIPFSDRAVILEELKNLNG